MTDPITLAIDCTESRDAAIERAVAHQSRSASPVFFVLLGGDPHALDETAYNAERISVVQCAPDETIDRGCELLASGEADALITSRAEVALVAIETVGLLDNATRAAVAACLPTTRPGEGRLCLILDVGATREVDANELRAFARIGTAYSTAILGRTDPTVALLGSDDTVALQLESDPQLSFVGSIQGYDVPFGRADVIVCDGASGRLTVGLLDGAMDAIFDVAKAAYDERLRWKFGLRLLEGGLRRAKEISNFTSSGHIVLGLRKTVLIAKPDADETEFGATIALAIDNVQKQIPDSLDAALQS